MLSFKDIGIKKYLFLRRVLFLAYWPLYISTHANINMKESANTKFK